MLMAHGWGASLDLLEPLALPLSRLGYQCRMIDLPGFGESDEPPRPFSIFDFADFCIAYLDQRGLDAVNFFGHSLGGRIGLILASDYSDRIQKMALSNSAGVKPEAPLHSRMRLGVYKSVRRSLEGLGAESAANRWRAAYNRRFGSVDLLNASPVMRGTLIKVVNQDLLEQARRVSVATILIWGDEDAETPLWMGQALEAAIPDAALIVHQGAGHYAYLDYPQKTAKIIDALYRVS